MRKILSILSLIALVFVTSTVVAAARPTHVDVSFSMAFDNDNKSFASPTITNKAVGSSLSLAGLGSFQSGHEFAYWVINGIVRNDLNETSSIRVQTKLDVKVILRPTNQHAVVFADSNGKMISLHYVTNGESVVSLAPNVEGYDKPGLVVNSNNPWKSLEGVELLDNVTSTRVYILQYSPSNVDVTINVTGGNATPASPKRNQLVTVVALDIPNFKYWKDNTGKVLSYNPTYVFTATKNIDLEAVTTGEVTATNLVTMSEDLAIRTGYETYIGKFELLPGHSIVEWGFLLSNTTLEPLTFSTSGVIIAKSNIYNAASNEYVMSFSNVTYTSIRAYAIIDNGETLEEVYNSIGFTAQDLFISEYIEGSSNDKAIEIFNGTGTVVNLSSYTLKVNSNGGASWGSPISLGSGNLPNGDVFVIANPNANANIKNLADLTSNSLSHNGNDAVGLFKNDILIDIFGIFNDAVTSWTVGTGSTIDNVIVRKSSSFNPNTSWNTSDWNVYPNNTLAYLGSHSISFTNSTDSQKLVIATNSLTIQAAVSESGDMNLPLSGLHGSTISWSSDSQHLITNAGIVALPETSPVTVVLTATLSIGTLVKTKQFEVSVGKTDSERVQIAKTNLSISTNISNAGDMGLPLSGQQNTIISWESSNPTIISHAGVVVLPGSGSIDVTLTATITFNGTSDTKTFVVTVNSESVVNYTVSFNTSGGTSYSDQTVQSGQTATNPGTPTKTGYDFAGWFESDLVTPYVFSTPIIGNLTIYAKWSPVPTESTITLNLTLLNISGNSYNSGAERVATVDGVGFGSVYTMASGSNIQGQASNMRIYNTTSLGRIKTISVVVTSSSANTMYGGTNLKPSSGVINQTFSNNTYTYDFSSVNVGYFNLQNNANAIYIVSITITYFPS